MKTTYRNDVEFKTMFVKETIKHRKADELIKGTYVKRNGSFKGCAVGCAIETLNVKLNKSYSNDSHSALEDEGLYPEWLARLQDSIFEGLEDKLSQTWPERFAKAIPVGVSFDKLESVKYQFCIYLIKENIKQVKGLDITDELKKQVIDASKQVMDVHKVALDTGEWDKSAAESAWSAAWSAVESAKSAARSAAWSAESAAESARSAAESAAESSWSASWSARSAAESAWSAAESARPAELDLIAEELIRLLESA